VRTKTRRAKKYRFVRTVRCAALDQRGVPATMKRSISASESTTAASGSCPQKRA